MFAECINLFMMDYAPSKAFLVICIPVRILCRYTFSMYFLILAACKGFSTLSYSFSIYYVVLILAPCKGFPPYVALLFLFTLFSFSDPFALALFHWIYYRKNTIILYSPKTDVRVSITENSYT